MDHECQPDAKEIEEWQDSLDDFLGCYGLVAAQKLLTGLDKRIGSGRLDSVASDGVNTIDGVDDLPLPPFHEKGVQAEKINLWNAMAMVVRASKKSSELGGHISTYASASTLYQIGFDYFFKGHGSNHGDCIYFQGHASPGIYARSFLEGSITQKQLDFFRQEAGKEAGLSSYPHPWCMPRYWQFPTVSMGLGPLQAIYQAYWLRYLQGRGIQDTSDRMVWAFCGDGEMDEPESKAGLQHAARERLDNCIFVINCNRQRLDGPVRGNGQIITELETVFRASGWRVIKVLWGQGWDKVWQLDTTGCVAEALSQMVDGQYQMLCAQGPRVLLSYLAEQSVEIQRVVEQLSEQDIDCLVPGGHDPVKVYTAYQKAIEKTGKPTVILAQTIKGNHLGSSTHSRNTAHNKKKMSQEDLHNYAEYCAVPLSKEAIERVDFYHPGQDSPEVAFIKKQREALGGYLPRRHTNDEGLPMLERSVWQSLTQSSGSKASSTTMSFVHFLNMMLRSPELSPYLVPIVADEARTFGMEGLFKKIGIYASSGQRYQPEDSKSIMSYTERENGQLLQEGLTEAGALSAWIAAATSYSTCQQPMIPLYIFYSMFGFQRVGDLLWLAGDIRARGFLLGATAGRTTLGGEGLQHNDGHSLVMASLVPNCISYDPCFQYELAVIMAHGMKTMMTNKQDVFYYITLMNENYTHPEMPAGVEEGIIQGMYALDDHSTNPDLRLLGSGAILREVIEAADQIRAFGFKVNVYSVTSFTELARQALRVKQNHDGSDAVAWVSSVLEGNTPTLAATDYVRTYAEQIRPYLQCPYEVLGTDGFGLSDSRSRLRQYFRVDADSIVYEGVRQLVDSKKANPSLLQELRKRRQADG